MCIAIVSMLHFMTPVNSAQYHDVYDRLYYIPIIFSAFFFGLRGGAAAAAGCGLVFLFHLLLQWQSHAHHVDLTGRYLEIIMYLVVGALTGVLSDLGRKQRRRAEDAYDKLLDSFEKAKESDRLAAIGTLAAGIAHEIRNPLGGVKGAVEILAVEFDADHPKRRFVEITNKEIQRMERIVCEFLDFSRPQEPSLAPGRINSVLKSVLELSMKNLSKNNVRLKMDLFEPDAAFNMDSNQLGQVFLNLVLNGVDSMPEGGELLVTTRRLGDEVEIEIADTGSGIDPADEERIFEPFFTKKQGGTGLGLPICRQIVERHGGRIAIRNRRDGQGAAARVALPVKGSGESEVG
ncbi:MAG TPA: ATP-binding protein [bacterium]|mgnify:CR=1 FL=1|nr:MAG: Sporulation kinase E [bacterium ADurb.Bin236]HPI76128.1 ATP-binding protein [bacterium]HPN94668.1 ATP-binding protein [bacterium]